MKYATMIILLLSLSGCGALIGGAVGGLTGTVVGEQTSNPDKK